jgi:hypothetical protein
MDIKDKDPSKEMDKSMPPEMAEKMKKEKEEKEKKDQEEKSLANTLSLLENLAKSGKAGRQSELLVKAQTGALSAEEKLELVKSFSGESSSTVAAVEGALGDALPDSIAKSSADVSVYLQNLHAGTVEAVAALAKSLDESDQARNREAIALAKGLTEVMRVVSEQGKLVKSLQAELATLARQPVSAPRSAANALGAAPAAREEQAGNLTKSQVLDLFDTLIEKSQGAEASYWSLEQTKFEATGQLSKDTLAKLQAARK